jgi:hypothetical protein
MNQQDLLEGHPDIIHQPINGPETSRRLNSWLDGVAIHFLNPNDIEVLRDLLSEGCTPLLLAILLQTDVAKYSGLGLKEDDRNMYLHERILEALEMVEFKTDFNPNHLKAVMLTYMYEGNYPEKPGCSTRRRCRPSWIKTGRGQMQFDYWLEQYFNNYHINPKMESKKFAQKVINIGREFKMKMVIIN